MSKGDDSLTHKDLARALGVSETTIKSYRRKFSAYFPLHSQGKPLRFKPTALDVCRRIRQGFADDLSVEEVRALLDEDFPKASTHRHLSIPDDSRAHTPETLQDTHNRQILDALHSIDSTLNILVSAQEKATARLDALQELLADFLSLHLSREDAFSRGVEELKRSWNKHMSQLAARQGVREAPPSPAKRVIVRNIYGGRNDYLIESAQDIREPAPVQPPSGPPENLLHLPLVIKSVASEYLGIAGKTEGAFSLQDLSRLMEKAYPKPHHFAEEWRIVDGGAAWRLELEQEDAIRPQRYALEIEAVKTPLGNEVALITRVEVQRRDMPPANFYAFIKQLKSRL